MSAETLEMPVNETLEQKRDQLISEYEDLALQVEKEKERIEFEDSGKFPLENYPSFVKLQEQLNQKEKEIETANQGMESVEAAGEIVGAKFDSGLEKGIAAQNKEAEKERDILEAKISQTEKDIENAQTPDEKLGLNIIRLSLQRKLDNIKQGLKAEAERKQKMTA